jgi:hypothetical protein
MRESGEIREKKRNPLIRQVKLFIHFETDTSKHGLNLNTLKARKALPLNHLVGEGFTDDLSLSVATYMHGYPFEVCN